MSIKLSNIIKNQNEELNWANIFHDTSKENST
jgi:HD superfamily phosphohydrolase YqeK